MAENYIDRIEVDGVERPIRDTSGSVRYDAAQSLTDAQKQQARNNISAMQGIESTDHPGCNYVLNGSTVEWVNPPMNFGVEYRTTERYMGKPVYVKVVNCGDFVADKTVSWTDTLSEVIGIAGINISSFRMTFPDSYISGDKIVLKGSDSWGGNIQARVKYIKTTD